MFGQDFPLLRRFKLLKTKIQVEMERWGSGNLNISIQDCDTVAIVHK